MKIRLLKKLRWDKRIIRTKTGKFIYQDFYDGLQWTTMDVYEPNRFNWALSRLHREMQDKLEKIEGYHGKTIIP
jgi:C1A family cysteine protease